LSAIDLSEIKIDEPYAIGLLARVDVNGMTTYIFSIRDDDNVLPDRYTVQDNETKLNIEFPYDWERVSITYGSLSITRAVNSSRYNSTTFPDDWILASEHTLRTIRPELKDKWSFIVVGKPTEDTMENLKDFNTMEIPNILTFYSKGTKQLEKILWVIVVITSILIMLLIYTTMSIEIEYRKKDIGILRSLGATRKTIGVIFLSQSIIIAIIGILIGFVIGIILSYGIASFSVHMNIKALFEIVIPVYTLFIIFVITLIASIIGSLIPIYKATKITVKEIM
jgi:ABC-type antimicrobial peptide transport system permease subunit